MKYGPCAIRRTCSGTVASKVSLKKKLKRLHAKCASPLAAMLVPHLIPFDTARWTGYSPDRENCWIDFLKIVWPPTTPIRQNSSSFSALRTSEKN